MTAPLLLPILATEEQVQSLSNVMARFESLPDSIQGEIGCPDTLMVNIGQMWIGIEPDGYAHS